MITFYIIAFSCSFINYLIIDHYFPNKSNIFYVGLIKMIVSNLSFLMLFTYLYILTFGKGDFLIFRTKYLFNKDLEGTLDKLRIIKKEFTLEEVFGCTNWSYVDKICKDSRFLVKVDKFDIGDSIISVSLVEIRKQKLSEIQCK